MANIDKELNQIKNAVYGREVRGAIHDGIDKINKESEDSKSKATEAHEVMESIMSEGFDNAALEANFEQKLDDKIANLQPEWTGFKEDVTSQLADMTNFNDYEIQNKTRKVEALFTIIDDDGNRRLLDLLRPLQQQYNIPMTTAIITDWVGNPQRVTKAELLQLVAEGWEVSSHTDKHVKLDELTPQEQYDAMKNSVDTLNNWGIDCTTICYPFSRRNNDTVIEARKLFRSGRSTDYGINRPPFQTWDITAINGEGKEHTLQSIKADIDDISENGGWGVYITHAGVDTNYTNWLSELIPYILSKGNIEFVTYNEALNRMGNIIDNGRYLERDKSIPHFVVGADGSMSSNTSPGIFAELRSGSIDVDFPPSFFEAGKIHYCITKARNNFPDVGVLETNTLHEGFFRQKLTTYTGLVFERNQEGDIWKKWQIHDAYIRLSQDGVNSESPLTEFENNKVTICRISSSNSDGFPSSSGGSLITNRVHLTNTSYQEFTTANTNDDIIYRRRWIGGQWSGWYIASPTYAATNSRLRDVAVNYSLPGQMFFSKTRNQPVWRNANNDGWVDANGDVVTV